MEGLDRGVARLDARRPSSCETQSSANDRSAKRYAQPREEQEDGMSMSKLSRRSMLRGSVGLAAIGTLGRPSLPKRPARPRVYGGPKALSPRRMPPSAP